MRLQSILTCRCGIVKDRDIQQVKRQPYNLPDKNVVIWLAKRITKNQLILLFYNWFCSPELQIELAWYSQFGTVQTNQQQIKKQAVIRQNIQEAR